MKTYNSSNHVCKNSTLIKVCLLGAESTGTTTMARALAKHFQTVWVPEYGRFYWEGRMTGLKSEQCKTSEFVHIAKMQNKMEQGLSKIANKILFCDTNSLATSIWHERYVGFNSKAVNNVSKNQHYDLYILTADDIPFVQDGTRDGEKIRHWMHLKFIKELKKLKTPFIILTGSHEKRLKKAIKECEKLLT